MKVRSKLVTLLSFASVPAFCVLAACGGAAKHEAKGPEANPWADYKGTYATPATAKEATAEAPKAEAKPKKEAKEAKVEKTEDASAVTAKKPSRGTIKGESVSSIGLDAMADASKGAIKGKVVSTKFIVGPQYEEVQVQLKGASVQIIRPAANPASDGPAISSPKARSSEIAKTDSSWYDEEADVLVVVSAGKMAGSQKVLGSILKR